MDTGSNLSKTVDRSRPAGRVCRRTGPVGLAALGVYYVGCPDASRSRSTASGLLQMVLVQYEAVRAAYMPSVLLGHT